MTLIELPIDTIRIDGGTQARAAISEATVSDYAEALTAGEELPPVVVFFDGVDNHLADGFHRLHANRRIGARTMRCDQRAGTLRDARLYAYGANKGHGLRRTNDDKRKAALGMLADVPDWSDRAIARHVGVSDPFIGKLRSSLLTVSSETATERTYTTKHGTTATMNVAGLKAKANKPAPADAAGDDTPAQPERARPAPAKQAPAAANEPAEVEQLREELKAEGAAHLETLADNAAMAKVFEADDKLAVAMAENKQLRALLKTANERISGLMFEKQEMTAEVRKLQRQVARLKSQEQSV